MNKQDLATVMREFIQEFEHTTGRMYQMLYGEIPDNEDDQKIAEVFDWFNFVFRSAIYALLSGWIEDKQDHLAVTINVNLSTGETTQERTGTEMTVPEEIPKGNQAPLTVWLRAMTLISKERFFPYAPPSMNQKLKRPPYPGYPAWDGRPPTGQT